MKDQEAVDLLWSEASEGRYFPPALHGALDLEQALRVQLGLMRLKQRKEAGGAKQSGWKVGLTSERVRRRFGTEARPFGHIMLPDVRDSGARVAVADFAPAAIEPELCFTIGTTLRGASVSPAAVRAAVAGVQPAFELCHNRAGEVADFTLSVADNLSQWGLVLGGRPAAVPAGLDLGAVEMTLRRNGEVVVTVLGADALDDHFLSLSKLVETLDQHGLALEAGQRIITGSFAKVDVAAGETWRAEFSGIGQVEVEII